MLHPVHTFEPVMLEAGGHPKTWVRGQSGCLVNIARADRIVLRKVGEEEHEVRAQMEADGREIVLFRGSFREAGDVLAYLGDALSAYAIEAVPA